MLRNNWLSNVSVESKRICKIYGIFHSPSFPFCKLNRYKFSSIVSGVTYTILIWIFQIYLSDSNVGRNKKTVARKVNNKKIKWAKTF